MNPNEPCVTCGDPIEREQVKVDGDGTSVTVGQQLVDGERWLDYGDPRIAWDRVARVWSVILRQHVTPRQAVLCMIGMKLIRESVKAKPDNVDDIEGYADILRRLDR